MEDRVDAKYARDVNCLREKEKNIRVGGLKRLIQALPSEKTEEIQGLFTQKLKFALLDLLKDPADACKELAVELLGSLIRAKHVLYDDIPAVIMALHSRLATDPCLETCEEVRIVEIQLLLQIMRDYPSNLPPNMAEVTDILAKLGKDRCPQVKNCVSTGVVFLCTSGMRFSCKKLLEGIRNNLTHQQFKVRSATIEAIGALALNESGIAEEIYHDFKKSQIDRRVEVRQIAYSTITEILLNISYPDLKKIEGKYVYLLLGGLSDEECTGKIPVFLTQIFEKVRKSAEEYGENCCDAMSENWLAARNLKEIIELALADIQEWTIQDYYRSRAVNSIGTAAVMAQGQMMPYLERILKVFFKAHSAADDAKYKELLENMSTAFALYSSFEEVLEVVNKLFSEQLSPTERSSGLIFYGKMFSSLNETSENLALVLSFFTSKDFTSEPLLFPSIHFCISELLNSFSTLVLPHLSAIFYLLLTLENTLKSAVHPTITLLANCCNYPDLSYLYSLQIPEALPKIITNFQSWTSESNERTQFKNLITRAGNGIKPHWDLILTVMTENSKREKESEVRYDMLVVLDSIADCREIDECIRKSSEKVLVEVVGPSCSWKVGASSVQVRIASLLCLKKLLENAVFDEKSLWTCWEKYFEGVRGCMDDDWDGELRIAAVHCAVPLLQNYSMPKALLEDLLKELMKRLDDSVDSIRISTTLPILLSFQTAIKNDFLLESFEKYIRLFFLHLDDENKLLQEGVLKILAVSLNWKKDQVLPIALEKQEKQRHPERIDLLLNTKS